MATELITQILFLMNKTTKIISWVTAGITAIILLQTLFFKFSGHEDAIHIFTTLGIEPVGRIGIGILELITGILLLMPRTRGMGAVLAIGLMLGAIAGHLGPLGIEVNGDGGQLFYMGIATLVLALITFVIHRKEVPIIGGLFGGVE